MKYFLTHLELSMIAILLIGLFGCRVEPGPVPRAMVVCGAIYIILHEFGRALYREWKKRQFTWTYTFIEEAPKPEEHRCYLFDLKEDPAWTEQKMNIS